MTLVGKVLWTVLPVVLGGVVHMLAVTKDWLPRLARPLDGGRRWRGRRVFGDHKTWRGVLVMIGGTAILTQGQAWVEAAAPALRDWNLVDLQRVGGLAAGAVWGLGYVLAELPNSFVKRRVGIGAGQGGGGFAGAFQVVVDQGDSAVGCALAGWAFLGLGAADALALAVTCTGLHLVINFLLGSTGLRRRKL